MLMPSFPVHQVVKQVGWTDGSTIRQSTRVHKASEHQSFVHDRLLLCICVSIMMLRHSGLLQSQGNGACRVESELFDTFNHTAVVEHTLVMPCDDEISYPVRTCGSYDQHPRIGQRLYGSRIRLGPPRMVPGGCLLG
jgi:hypothetical protein